MASSPPYELLRTGQKKAYLHHVGLQMAGNETYGNWRKELVIVNHLPPFIRAFVDEARDIAMNQGSLSILDAGCGNGAFGLPVAIHLAQTTEVPIHALFIDKQPDAIRAVNKYLSNIPLPDTLKTQSICQDIEEIGIPDCSVDVVILKNLLHFIDPQKTARVLEKLFRALRPGGIVFIDFCSVFNPCAIGFEDKPRFEEMLVFLSQKSRTLPHAAYHKGFDKMMYFHTPASMTTTMEQVGFHVMRLEECPNINHPNGWSREFPENFRMVMRKSPKPSLINSTLFSLN